MFVSHLLETLQNLTGKSEVMSTFFFIKKYRFVAHRRVKQLPAIFFSKFSTKNLLFQRIPDGNPKFLFQLDSSK